MNPLIQAGPEYRERDAKPQSLKYLLAVAAIIGVFSVAAVATGLIPAADTKHVGNGAAPDSRASQHLVASKEEEGRPCAG